MTTDSRIAMASALKRKPKLKTFHATVVVTRAEEWSVDAHTPEEALELLAAGQGHRCYSGDHLHAEVQKLHGD
jgi:hypothetical protein